MGNFDEASTVGRMTSGDPLDVSAALQFFMEVDKLKGVERRNWLADGSRRENTAEHSWHLGIAAMVFSGFATEPVDLGRAVCMALVHDMTTVSDAELLSGMLYLWERMKIVVDPTGALGAAGLFERGFLRHEMRKAERTHHRATAALSEVRCLRVGGVTEDRDPAL